MTMIKFTKKVFVLLGIISLFWSLSYATESVAINERTNTSYATLQEAFSANEVRAGDSIKLLKDIDEINEMTNVAENSFSSILIEKDIILKGNWFEIKRPRNYWGTLFTIQWGTNVTFSGVVIDGQAPDWKQNFTGLPNQWYIEVPVLAWSGDISATNSSIINKGNLLFSESIIKDMVSYSNSAYGLGIKSLKGSTLTIEKSEFRHLGWKWFNGWAIYTESGVKLKVKDSIFKNNAISWGHYFWWAIYIGWGNDEKLPEIENTQFIKNHAMNWWAIGMQTAAIIIKGSQFIANTVGNDWSAIDIRDTSNSQLQKDSSYIDNTIFSGNIGISTKNQSLGTINLASYHGKELNFNNCEFINNVWAMGWAIWDYGNKLAVINISKSLFTKNDADGVFYSQNMQISLKDSIITWNISSNGNNSVASILGNSSFTTESTIIENNGNLESLAYSTIWIVPYDNWAHTQIILKKGTVIRDNTAKYWAIYAAWHKNNKNQKTTIIMEQGSKVYNNKAITGGDDFYFLRSTSNTDTCKLNIQLQSAANMNVKDQNGENIVGWFSDRANNRHSPLNPQENPAPLTIGVDWTLNYTGVASRAFALKAATKDQTPPSLQQINQQRIKRNKPILITFTGSDNLKIKSLELIGNLPEGLTLQKKEISDRNREATISGSITRSGKYPLSFIITDFFGSSSVMNFDLVIYNPSNTDINTSNSWTSQQNQSIDSHWTGDNNTEETEQNAAETKSSTETKAEDKPELVDGKTKYQDTVIFNPSIENGKCYTRREYLGIKDSEKIVTSEEFKKALSFLRSYEMTMFDSVDSFAPYRNLSREEAAKIFSNFAINVLCRKPDKNLSIHYSDVENADPTLKPYITLAYQLGVMKGSGMGDGEFRPKDYISKAEVNAVLIRMILKSYLDEQTSGNKMWYSEYNKVATDLGIINQGAWAEPVLRNNVALMLFRAYKNQVFDWRDIDYFSYVLNSRDLFVK